MQVWLSPWQVAHLLSIVHMVKENVPQVDPLLPDPASDPLESSEPRGHKPPSLTTQLRVTGVFEVPLLVVLCLVRTLAAAGPHLGAQVIPPRTSHSSKD